MPDEGALLGEVMVPDLDGEPPLEEVEQGGRRLAGAIEVAGGDPRRDPPAGAAGEGEESAGVPRQRVERDLRAPARGIHPPAGDEGGEVAISLARLGEEDEVGGAVVHDQRQFAADDAADLRLARRLREAHGPPEVVVVGEGEGAHA